MNETHPSTDQLVDYLHGELTAAEDAAIHAHLATCSECERRRDEEAAITEALRAQARAVERDVPLGLFTRTRATVAKPHTSRWWFAFPAAAALAAAIYVGIIAHGGGSSRTVEAAYYVNAHAVMTAREPFSDGVSPSMMTLDDEAH
jgi:anti-sigma factor RsiW